MIRRLLTCSLLVLSIGLFGHIIYRRYHPVSSGFIFTTYKYEEPHYSCDACGKPLWDKYGHQLIGASFSVYGFPPKFLKAQLGPYTAKQTYRVCWECMLKAYKVKP